MIDELIQGKIFYAHLNNDPNIYKEYNVNIPATGINLSHQVQLLKNCFHTDKVSYLKQIHSSDVYMTGNNCYQADIEGDALVTTEANHVICVKTADCVPILLTSLNGDIISIIHAGWRGAFNGIIKSAIQKIHHSKPQAELVALIGPHIRQESYEVDQNFYNQFIEQSPNHSTYFSASKKTGHYQFDLTNCVTDQLRKANIEGIIDAGIDTYKEKIYPSFRRVTHEDSSLKNHILSAIVISK